MNGPTCIGDPISWLRLERRRLDELSDGERQAVDRHLAACPACAACDAQTGASLAPRPLPAQAMEFAGGAGWRLRGLSRLRRWLVGGRAARAWAPLAVVGGVAAVLLLWLARPGSGPPAQPTRVASESMQGIKGGDVALSLVRERQGIVQHDALTFTTDDRWKVLVTCPSERVLFWDIVVDDGGTTTFPLSPATPIACGNRVALPGAFRLSAATPAPTRICLWLAENPIDRSQARALARAEPRALERDQPPALERAAVCATLTPEPDRR